MAIGFETKEGIVLITDNELLGRYLNKNDKSAFEELVRRHSNLVMGVCRNMLFHTHDAEDAYQATFLILSRKSAKLLHHGSIAGWLYQTAMRNCLQVRRRKGRARETEMIEEPVGTNEPWQTIADAQERDLIYQEINQLPKRYREVIVLCHLEGHTRSEAAEFLDWTEAAVKAALARGRNLLRRRLIRSGIMTSVALAMMGAATAQAQSAVTEPLIASAIQLSQNVTPTASVGSSSQFVHTISHQGVLSMHSVTLIKAVSLAASIAIVVSIPLALLAVQTTVDGTGQDIVTHFDGASPAGDKTGVGVEIGEIASFDQPKDETEAAESVGTIADSSGDKFANHSYTALRRPALNPNTSSRSDQRSDTSRFAKENSTEFWQLMLQSYENRAQAAMLKASQPQQTKFEALTNQSEAFEYQAKIVEARLNLERIKFESSQPGEIASESAEVGMETPDSTTSGSVKSQANSAQKTRLNPESQLVLASHLRSATVFSIDPKTGLFAIGIGESSGVKTNCRLSIYRGNRFLAYAVIVDTQPKLSVAKPESESKFGLIRQGDKVHVNLESIGMPAAAKKATGVNTARMVFLATIEQACELYKHNVGKYPASLNDLFQRPVNMSTKQWGGPFIENTKSNVQMAASMTYSVNDEKDGIEIGFKKNAAIATNEKDSTKTTFVPPSSTAIVEPGEVLLVESMTDATLNRRVVVQADHTIVLPFAGVVSVRNKTTTEITEILDAKFSKYVASPTTFVVRESASTPMSKK